VTNALAISSGEAQVCHRWLRFAAADTAYGGLSSDSSNHAGGAISRTSIAYAKVLVAEGQAGPTSSLVQVRGEAPSARRERTAMRILVTGGAGFVGARVVARLMAAGHDVVVFDRTEPHPGSGIDNVQMEIGDIRDAAAVSRAVETAQPARIAHLAGVLTDEVGADPAAAVAINCLGTRNVLHAAAAAAVDRVVWASSASVFGGMDPGPELIGEDNPFTPISIYAGTKVLCELLADNFATESGIATVGLRLALLIGVGKASGISGRLGRELIERPLAGQKGVVPGGDDIPSWLWVDDAARAFELAILAPEAPARVYNVGGDERPIREAVEIVRRHLGPEVEIEVEPGRAGMEHHPDSSRIERDLGFQVEWPPRAAARRAAERECCDRSKFATTKC
jgi:UDP-glucose 4-epimerase